MDCWNEEAIEWAAIRIVAGHCSPEIDALAAHALDCVRCGDLLALFEGTERGIQRDLPVPRVLPLVKVQALASRPTRPIDSPAIPAEFDVAAETARPSRIADITLSTEDGGCIVRIFPKPGGEGARAVLVSAQDRPARMSLMIDDLEYPFDETGIADIPRFPASGIRLVAF